MTDVATVDQSELAGDLERRKQGESGPSIFELIRQQESAIERALPRVGVTAERFTRIVTTEIRKNPKLAGCTIPSLFGAMMYAAQLGIEPGGPLGRGWLVPYGRECTFILGYQGIVELFYRSDESVSIVAREVRANDHFEYEYGLEDKLVHRPALADRGDAIAYYGIAKIKDGHVLQVMNLEEINRARGLSRASEKGPWVDHFDAMARKTVVRRMLPYLPVSTEIAEIVAQDEHTVRNLDPMRQSVTPAAIEVRELPPVDDAVDPHSTGDAPAADGAGGTGPDGSERSEETPAGLGPSGAGPEGASPAPESTEELVLEHPPEDGVPYGYAMWSKDELVEECRKRELPYSGANKDVLVDKLRADDGFTGQRDRERDARSF